MPIIDLLETMRSHGGEVTTRGLPDDVILRFAATDPLLPEAIRAAHEAWKELHDTDPGLLALDEDGQVREVQSGYVNFYAGDMVNPYVALAGRGPWIVTLKGAVLHDSGGYGMLGFGHTPEAVVTVMGEKQVMANVMTPSISQKRFSDALRNEVGHTRGHFPFDRILCLNSGSEAVSCAARIADINAKLMTDPGGRYANKSIKMVSLKGGFHGRTDRPAQFSDSTRHTYCKYLATFRDRDNLITVDPNDCEQLKQVFGWAESNGHFIEALFFEPVMGEGNPGLAITPEFYEVARSLTREHGSLLLVDSIQAGLRAHGVLSVCDYPGFEALDAPDMETWSKALNAGQYPLSVLALNEFASGLYQTGVYGNTMTTNPRALEVARAVLLSLTPEIRNNIVERGREFLGKLEDLREELGGPIVHAQGTGLLISAELDRKRFKSHGANSIEEEMRLRGINVIHGGLNSLRYTPHFNITSEEVDLIIDTTREALLHGPARVAADKAEAA